MARLIIKAKEPIKYRALEFRKRHVVILKNANHDDIVKHVPQCRYTALCGKRVYAVDNTQTTTYSWK